MNAIVTIEVGDKIKEVSNYTLPLMIDYAKKCNAEFVILEDQKDYEHPTFMKFQIKDLLDKYDRVLFIDADVEIKEDAPNLFNIVPKDSIGAYNEAIDVPERVKQQIFTMEHNNLSTYNDERYYNAGVMLVSKCHQELFTKPPKEITFQSLLRFAEQAWLNYKFVGQKMYDITYRFNYMDLCSQVKEEECKDIYFRHYASGDRKKLIKKIKMEN